MSAAPPDLLAHLAGDLEGCELVRTAAGAAVVTPPDGVPPFAVEVAVERRRLLQLSTTVVILDGPLPDELGVAAAGIEVTDERLLLRHTGQVRRTGVEVVARTARRLARATAAPRDPVLGAIADRLRASADLRMALLPLDTTRAELVRVGANGWHLELELMGGSHVRTTLPPSQAYVRLAKDQREALLAVVRAVAAVLPTRTPSSVGVRTTRGGLHLPPRGAHAGSRTSAG